MNPTPPDDFPRPAKKSWKHVYQGLKAQIEEGKRPVGSPCPGELELSEIYGVARGTVRNALSKLWQDGYLEFLPGRVRTVRLPEPVRLGKMFLHKFKHAQSFGQHIIELAKSEGGKWEAIDEVLAGPELCPWYTVGNEPRLDVAAIREQLRLADDDVVCWCLRARYARNNPAVLQWAVIAAKFLGQRYLRIDDLVPGGLTKLYRDNGIYRSRASTTYQATSASRDEAQHLRIEKGTPLIEELRTSFFRREGAKEDTPYEWLVTLYTNRVRIGFDWEDEEEKPAAERTSDTVHTPQGKQAGKKPQRA